MVKTLKYLTDWYNVLRLASVQYIALTDESQNTTQDQKKYWSQKYQNSATNIKDLSTFQ